MLIDNIVGVDLKELNDVFVRLIWDRLMDIARNSF